MVKWKRDQPSNQRELFLVIPVNEKLLKLKHEIEEFIVELQGGSPPDRHAAGLIGVPAHLLHFCRLASAFFCSATG